MAKAAFKPTGGRPFESETVFPPVRQDDILDQDRIGFDAWLLPEEPQTRAERAIRLISTYSGPALLIVGAFAVAHFL